MNTKQNAAPTWAQTYRAASLRLLDMQEGETDGLVRSALGDAAAKYLVAALEHEEIQLRNAKAYAAECAAARAA